MKYLNQAAVLSCLLMIFLVNAVAQGQNFSTVIDPDEYIVAPGDRFEIDFWNAGTDKLDVTVTSEGAVLLESMGRVEVGGLTLTEAKERLGELIKQYFSDIDFSISLMGVRQIKILVTGAVKSPGLYDAFVSQRVSEIINKAGGLIKGASSRNIRLKSENRTTDVDLTKFERTGDLKSNPYLISGYHIHVPLVLDSSQFIHITGEVVSPGRIEYKPGDNLGTIIDMAYGLTGLQGGLVKIFRKNGNNIEQFEVSVDDTDTDLRPGDKIIVLNGTGKFEDDYFIITGKVRNPGIYPCTDPVALSEVINQAGGTVEKSDLNSISVFRKFPETGMMPKIIKNNYNGADVNSGLLPLSINGTGEERLKEIMIIPGDSICVPSLTGTAGLYGMVKYPGLIKIDSPISINSLINKAGGYAPRADKKRFEITRKGTGGSSFVPGSSTVNDGDVVFVNRLEKDSSLLSKLRDAAVIIGGLGLTYLAIDNMAD